MPPVVAKEKVHYLDGLRGFMAVIVVLDHWIMMGRNDFTSDATSVFWEPWFLRTPLRLFVDGGFAVAIFFVLSGYVLTKGFFVQPDRKDMICSASVRRYPRLMIPAFVSLLMYWSWLHFGPYRGYSGCHSVGEMQNNKVVADDDKVDDGYTVAFNLGDIVLNGLIGQWTFEPAIYTIQWTLQIELIGSFIIFILAYSMCNFSYFQTNERISIKRHFFIMFFEIVIPIIWWIGGDNALPLPVQYLWTFLVGMHFALIDSEGTLNKVREWRNFRGNERRFVLIQVSLLLTGLYFGTFPYQQTLGSTELSMWCPLFYIFPPWINLSIGASCVMFSLLVWTEFQSLLSSKFAKVLGNLSFSIYLLHYQVLILFDILIMPWLAPFVNGGGTDRTGAAFICLIGIFPSVYYLSLFFFTYCDNISVSLSNDFKELFVKYFPSICGCLTKNRTPDDFAKKENLNSSDKDTVMKYNRDIEKLDPVSVGGGTSPLFLGENGATTANEQGNGSKDSSAVSTALGLSDSIPLSIPKSFWISDRMILLYFVILFVVVGAIPPSKPYSDCYSSQAPGGILN